MKSNANGEINMEKGSHRKAIYFEVERSYHPNQAMLQALRVICEPSSKTNLV